MSNIKNFIPIKALTGKEADALMQETLAKQKKAGVQIEQPKVVYEMDLMVEDDQSKKLTTQKYFLKPMFDNNTGQGKRKIEHLHLVAKYGANMSVENKHLVIDKSYFDSDLPGNISYSERMIRKHHPKDLKSTSFLKKFPKDKELIEYVLKNCCSSGNFDETSFLAIDESLRHDNSWVENILEKYPRYAGYFIQHGTDEIKNNEKIVIPALRDSLTNVQFANSRFAEDVNLVRQWVTFSNYVTLPEKVFEDISLVEKMLIRIAFPEGLKMGFGPYKPIPENTNLTTCDLYILQKSLGSARASFIRKFQVIEKLKQKLAADPEYRSTRNRYQNYAKSEIPPTAKEILNKMSLLESYAYNMENEQLKTKDWNCGLSNLLSQIKY